MNKEEKNQKIKNTLLETTCGRRKKQEISNTNY